MKAAVLNQTGGPEAFSVQEFPDPEPKPNEVVVRLNFAALNHVDVWIRSGNPAYPIKGSQVIGSDGAGTVESVGSEVEGVAVGDPVAIFPAISCGQCDRCKRGQDNQCEKFEIFGTRRPGTYAQKVAVPDTNVVPVPAEFPLEKAAAFPLAYLAAWHMLFGRAQLVKGETVYVVGSGSGVGAAAIQLAKWKGARVFASTTSKDKTALIKAIGAEVLVTGEGVDAAAWVIEKTSGRGADVVVEHVGPATWEASFKALGRYGRLVTCGETTGPTVPLTLRGLFSRDASILGARMGTEREFQELSRVVFSGGIQPVIDKIFKLDDIVAAHQYLDGHRHVGKILIDLS